MAYQSEIEFRVKVLDSELKELEKRLEKLQNPFDVSGKRRPTAGKAAAVRAQKEEADLIRQSIEDLDRLRETKAQKRQQTMVRRVRFERDQRIKAARDVAKAEATIQRENQRLREDLALGAGFPLLFGGGLGSVAGGVLGAASGGGKGGFGAQILFSAIGQQIDQFFSEVRESADLVANSIGGTTDSLEALQEAGVVVQGSLIEYVQSLEDSGQAVAAYNLVQKELTDIYGNEGVNSLRLLKDANETANEASSNLSVALQKELAPAFTKLTNLGAKLADGFAEIVPVLGLLLNPLKEIPSQKNLDIVRQQQQQERIDVGAKGRTADISATERLAPIEDATSSLERQTQILELGNKLTNDRVVLLKQEDLIAEAAADKAALQVEAFKNISNARELAIIQAKEQKIQSQLTLDLAKLQLSVDQARTSEAEKLARQAKTQAREAERAAKAAKREQEKISQLQIEVGLQDRLFAINRQIAEAETAKDLKSEARLKIQAELEKRAARIDQVINKSLNTEIEALEIKKEEIRAAQAIFNIMSNTKALQDANAEKAAQTLQGLKNEQALLQARLDGRLEEEQLQQRAQEIASKNEGLTEKQVANQLRSTEVLKEQVKALDQLESMYASIGQSISSGIVDALSAAVEGTKSLADVASQTLRQVANILLQFGVNTALGGIPGLSSFFPGRATGGPVSGGSPYMVGEKGPELFVPNTSGNIVPNNKLGGGGGGSTNVVVNVDAKGSSASGDSGAGKQLGGLIGAAVQAELIKQQRPGGLLSR